jgi:hypothetical protein
MKNAQTQQHLFKTTRALIGAEFYATAGGGSWRMMVRALADKCGASFEEANHFLEGMEEEGQFWLVSPPPALDLWEAVEASHREYLALIG